MKKKFIFLMLIMMLSVHVPSQSFAKGGLIKSIINFFKGGGDDLIKTGDDAVKGVSKTKEEIFDGIKSRASSETVSTSSAEARIAENVGIDQHSVNFTSLKNTPRGRYIKNLKDKFKGGDEIADVGELFDIDLNASNDKSNSNNKFYSFVIFNWVGKIYKSNYFSKPEENKILLVCDTKNDLFYISLLMEQEPKRAFLQEHIRNDNNNRRKIKPQELVVLEDTEEIKIMSTQPEQGKEWPSNYFTIYSNQGFEYDYSSLNVDLIKNKANLTKKHKFNCFKATEKGLL